MDAFIKVSINGREIFIEKSGESVQLIGMLRQATLIIEKEFWEALEKVPKKEDT